MNRPKGIPWWTDSPLHHWWSKRLLSRRGLFRAKIYYIKVIKAVLWHSPSINQNSLHQGCLIKGPKTSYSTLIMWLIGLLKSSASSVNKINTKCHLSTITKLSNISTVLQTPSPMMMDSAQLAWWCNRRRKYQRKNFSPNMLGCKTPCSNSNTSQLPARSLITSSTASSKINSCPILQQASHNPRDLNLW